ncbi:MAG: ATP-binding cassette domain-containing protein [Actinomycetota bacterium]|nr:ATP-binding cassette domain-containing protein [Actinomycetota bacterium]
MEKEAVVVEGLTRRFGDYPAVRDIHFEVLRGEIFGLLGPNGAGKTTTIRMLATVLTPDSGTARINGCDIRERKQEVRAALGVLTTFVGLYERLTARENLEYFARLYGLRGRDLESSVDNILAVLEAEDFQHKKASELSTGMRQKIALARSVVHDPPVIILDEPTLGLDVLASETVRGYMAGARRRGRTLILSTHDMHMAQELCERAAILHRGEILAVDAPGSIISDQGAADLEKAFIKLVEGKRAG